MQCWDHGLTLPLGSQKSVNIELTRTQRTGQQSKESSGIWKGLPTAVYAMAYRKKGMHSQMLIGAPEMIGNLLGVMPLFGMVQLLHEIVRNKVQ